MKFTVKALPPADSPLYLLVDENGREVCKMNDELPDNGKGIALMLAQSPAMIQVLLALLGTQASLDAHRPEIRRIVAAVMGNATASLPGLPLR